METARTITPTPTRRLHTWLLHTPGCLGLFLGGCLATQRLFDDGLVAPLALYWLCVAVSALMLVVRPTQLVLDRFQAAAIVSTLLPINEIVQATPGVGSPWIALAIAPVAWFALAGTRFHLTWTVAGVGVIGACAAAVAAMDGLLTPTTLSFHGATLVTIGCVALVAPRVRHALLCASERQTPRAEGRRGWHHGVRSGG